MSRKRSNQPVKPTDVSDMAEVRMAFLALRVRTSQATSRISRTIHKLRDVLAAAERLEMHMVATRFSLFTLRDDLDAMLKGIERERDRQYRRKN